MQENKDLGQLIAVHGTSSAYLQRAAIVSILSFLFFMAGLILFYIAQRFLYFLLSSAFLIVYIFTMAGWLLQRRNAVSIHEKGLVYKDRRIKWADVTGIARNRDKGLQIDLNGQEPVSLPPSIQALDRIEAFVRSVTA